MSNSRVLLGFSSGIDSCAAVEILRSQGYTVTALTIDTTGDQTVLKQAQQRAAKLGVEWRVYDAREVFKREIIDYFCSEYMAGRTPAPCTRCNTHIKWRILAKVADEMGIYHIATGHYFSITKLGDRYYVTKGVDERKDQSYYLWGLSQEILQRALTPMGGMIKSEIKSDNKQRESMGVCFLQGKPYGEFITSQGYDIRCGDVVTRSGDVVGRHQGIALYTIGQRRGVGIPEGLRVVDIDADKGNIIVGRNFELIKKKLYINNCNIVDIRELLQSADITIKIRGIGRNPELPVTVKPCDEGYVITAQDEVYAPAKGQPLVFYRNNLVIGGGIVVDFD